MNKKILIINANYYKKICQYLLDGALDYLKNNSKYEHDILEVPGAFEIPGVLNLAIQSDKYNGFILLGCVIRGETEHYNFICQAIMDSVLSLINQYKICMYKKQKNAIPMDSSFTKPFLSVKHLVHFLK